ncbi:MAG: 3-hydroxyacyl-ACP dehydratase FabZ [Bacteroidales bacterium]|nr:3-hydroxyacyl-ACP dehydratase FabZ [Bacteroidales bacterium]
MNREEIKKLLPHREPMLLVDWTEKQEDGSIRATYNVTGEEWFLKGHFPDFPVVPGVVICEIMAQSCTLLLGEDLVGHTPFYGGLDKVRFKRMVRPGDTIETSARMKATRGPLFIIEAEARVEGQLACKGELTFYLMDSKDLKK